MNKDINKNLKDTTTDLSISIKDISFPLSYSKTHKLITALYMVTDIMDREEPIRNKLRTLGTEILSDIYNIKLARTVLASRVDETMSFLSIASAMNFISEMNHAILHREFLELKRSIQKYTEIKPVWLEELFSDTKSIGHTENYKGHQASTRIGVQKGSTLMKALSDKLSLSSAGHLTAHLKAELLKEKRRENIIKIIKEKNGTASIKDIMTQINNKGQETLSEKTLQRELLSMVKDSVLDKIGEKRWSRYSIK